MKLLTAVLLASVALLLLAEGPAAVAATITVNSTADVIADDGVCTLREAITAANTDAASGATPGECPAGSGADTIHVPAGTYTLSIPGAGEDANATGDLDITADLTISGAGDATTIIDGADLDRVFHIVSGTVEISGLTIQNGTASGGCCGGGILHSGALTLNSSVVSGNTAAIGGGISGTGSAIGPVILNNSTVTGNTAGGGGGIFTLALVTLNSSTVSGNSAPGGSGGGIGDMGGTVTLNNSTVSGNTAGTDGGGIRMSGGTVTLNNSTVSSNTASSGGGVAGGGAALKNTIVAGNTPNDCSGPITSAGHNLDSDNTCNLTALGDLPGDDPKLGPLADSGGPTQTHALLPGSFAIDGGSGDCPPPATDQRGFPRPHGPICDIGAFEAMLPAARWTVNSTVDVVDANPGDGVCDDGAGNCTLRGVIGEANALAGPQTADVPAGTYTLSLAGAGEDANASGDLDITAELTIRGADGPTTIIDAAALDRVIHIAPGVTAAISGATIQNGSASGPGGGIYNPAGMLTLNGSAVSGNSTSFGGGGIASGGMLAITNSAVSSNTATGGGGIFNFGTLTLTNSTISGNTATEGGGVSNHGSLTATDGTISGNSALGADITRGGGIFNGSGGTVTLNSSTVSGNASANFGGGIINLGGSAATLKNTVVANSPSGGDCSGTITSAGHNLDSDNTCSLTAAGDLPGDDPMLGPLANNGGPTQTHALLPSSPAIDAGSTDCPPPATDQRGVPRPFDGDSDDIAACDIGAFEAVIVPTVFTVNSTADAVDANRGDGACNDGADKCTLRAAIGEANAVAGAQAVAVPTGTYTLGIFGAGEDAAATGDLDITADLTINGAGAATTIIDGADLDRVLHIVGGTVEISGLTIRNGAAGGNFGGGILHSGALTLNSSVVSGNTAAGGGGISGTGSGIGPVTLNNSTVSGNTAGGGGGIFGLAVVTLNSSTVSGNSAPGGSGGGIGDMGGTVTLNNSTVSGNTAGTDGGGIRMSGGTVTLNNSTVSSNTASSGGGVAGGGAALKNTIVAGNTPNDCPGPITSAGHNLDSDNTCGLTAPGDLPGVNPMLGPLADNGGPTQTHALLPGSPAIDAGSPDCPPPFADQRGVARPQGAACDIGAFELELLTPGRVTGEGKIAPSGRKATFVFDVQFSSGDPAPTGQLTYTDRAANTRIKAASYDTLVITGTHASFTGTATVNGVPGKAFKVEVDDLGEPGSGDTFKIEILEPGGYTASGVLTEGNIKIHQ